MAYFGVQYSGGTPKGLPAVLKSLEAAFASANGPRHWDRAAYVDEAGYSNTVSVAYWDDRAAFDVWFPGARAAWTGVEAAGLGKFIEVLSPSVNNYETLFSSLGRPEGVAVVADGMSGEVLEHAYWGGMRDRIPLSQTNEIAAVGVPAVVREGRSLRVKPHENICSIRSGQDWSDTDSAERKMYLEDVEPVLREGMEFLRDEGLAIGCFANRYMTVLDGDGRPTEKSYGMSWWKSLATLERSAEFAPNSRAHFRCGNEISVDTRPGCKAPALSRGYGGSRSRSVL